MTTQQATHRIRTAVVLAAGVAGQLLVPRFLGRAAKAAEKCDLEDCEQAANRVHAH